MGLWRIELIEGRAPRMIANDTMKELLGITGRGLTPEETYTEWYSRIEPSAVASVLESVGRMRQGQRDENTYLWRHPAKGPRYVRCGGTAKAVPGGVILRGYHYDVDEQVRADREKDAILEAISQEYHTMWLITKADLEMHFIRSNGLTTIQKAVDMGRGNANYDAAITKYVNTYVVEEDRERVGAAVTSARVLKETAERRIYTVDYLRRDDEGRVTFHQMAFADAGDGFILAYHDIDALIRREKREQEQLRGALKAAEDAAREKDAIHLALGSGDWSMTFDERGEMTACTWSRRFRQMLGYTSVEDFPDELRSWSDLLHPDDKERVLAHYWDVVRDYSGQKTYDVYYRLATRDRGERWFRAVGRLTRRPDGSPIAFYGLFLDVDDDRRNDLKHETETSDLIQALSSVYIDVILVDLSRGTSKPVKLDRYASRLDDGHFAERDRVYAMAAYVDEHVHPDDRRHFEPFRTIEGCRSYFAEHREASVDYRSVHGSETHYMQLQMVRPAADGDDLIMGYRNVDAQEAERLRRVQQEHELLGVVETLSTEYSAVYLINAATHAYRVIHENAVGNKITQVFDDADTALAQYVETMVAEEDREAMRLACRVDRMEESIPETGLRTTPYRRVDRDGERHYQLNAAKFVSDEGKRYFVLGFRDNAPAIERELKVQQALRDAYDNAEAANHAKSDFLQTMSHDIRTPMNGIIGMTAIAAAHIDDKARVQDSLLKITAASKHLLSLINEVLDMSKIESGKVSLTEEEFDIAELIDNLVTMVRPQVQAHRHELSVSIQKVAHEKVIGDPSRVQQVFVNMMSNAIKYTPDGGRIGLDIR